MKQSDSAFSDENRTTAAEPVVSALRDGIPSALQPIAERIPEGVVWAYKISIRGNRLYHQWELNGPRGGIHVSAWWSPSTWTSQDWSGGIEGHSPIAREYEGGAPSQDHCWLIGAPCWHDGSSLQFSEQIAPYLPRSDGPMGPDEHADVLHVMLNRYDSWLPTAQAIEARRAATTGAVVDESAVRQDAPEVQS